MDIGDFVTSTRTLIRIFVILLYVPVGVVCYWRLIPPHVANSQAIGKRHDGGADYRNRYIAGIPTRIGNLRLGSGTCIRN